MLHGAFVLITDGASNPLGRTARVHDAFRDRERDFTATLSPKHPSGPTIGSHCARRDIGGKFGVGVADIQVGSGGVNVASEYLSVEGDGACDDTVLQG